MQELNCRTTVSREGEWGTWGVCGALTLVEEGRYGVIVGDGGAALSTARQVAVVDTLALGAIHWVAGGKLTYGI